MARKRINPLSKAGRPSPVDDFIVLDFMGEKPAYVKVIIYDQLGRTHLEIDLTTRDSRSEITQLERLLNPGGYFIAVRSSEFNEVFKFIKN